MYIDNNKSGIFFRSFHNFLYVLSTSTVLFSVSGCNGIITTDKGTEPAAFKVESQTPSEADTLQADILPTLPLEDRTSTEIPYDETEASIIPADEYASTQAVDEEIEEMLQHTGTQAEINLLTLENLNNTYGLNIRYGSEVSWSYGTSGKGISDEELIASRLSLLEECLSLYPKELFTDLNSYSAVSINLIDSLGGADGYTDARNASSIQIALNCSNSDVYFKLAFHHELFHFIEYCIMNQVKDGLYLMNTDDLTDTALYGTTDYTGTIYDSDSDIYHQYFTSIYGKTNSMEDRAELFSYYMGYTVKDCMKVNDSPITLKMKRIAYAIRLCCPSLSEYPDGTLPWEKKITY